MIPKMENKSSTSYSIVRHESLTSKIFRTVWYSWKGRSPQVLPTNIAGMLLQGIVVRLPSFYNHIPKECILFRVNASIFWKFSICLLWRPLSTRATRESRRIKPGGSLPSFTNCSLHACELIRRHPDFYFPYS